MLDKQVAACQEADGLCSNAVEDAYVMYSGRGSYDILHVELGPIPPNYFLDFLNQHWVQQALGVPINYTESSNYAFSATSDYPRSDHGNFSFTHVYEAGHEVPAYQTETAYEIFYRALFNRDLATGKMDIVANGSYLIRGTGPREPSAGVLYSSETDVDCR
ncbi:hypothetical protein N7510_003047 [Penicillium lagena]|uniref:uncharacterized protein n=1 Tax=Penicillium lagena TaxID=94218 RepID=UPI00253F97D3|nr:uncharacterized protein N7510_003047 [Penicillium lagena]KAJ5619063.1 hypothetical protein N7510_003047 [Penicillium lagena]